MKTTPATTTDAPTRSEVDFARHIDLELDWYFSYAEAALSMGSLSLLPTHLATAAPATGSSEDAVSAQAQGLALGIQATLNRLDSQATGVLRATYTPRRWPAPVTREFRALAPIVVRLACATDPWPSRGSNEGLETAAAKGLARALVTLKPREVRTLRKEADRLLGSAVRTYAKSRS